MQIHQDKCFFQKLRTLNITFKEEMPYRIGEFSLLFALTSLRTLSIVNAWLWE